MTNLQKFAAQRLTKQQMSQVKGGEQFDCKVEVETEGNTIVVSSGPALGNSKEEVAQQLLETYQSVYYEDDRIIVTCK